MTPTGWVLHAIRALSAQGHEAPHHRHTWMVESPKHETEVCIYCPARRSTKVK
jgi:hypothetical protein